MVTPIVAMLFGSIMIKNRIITALPMMQFLVQVTMDSLLPC